MTLTPEQRDQIRRQVDVRQHELEAAPLPAGVVPIKIQCTWSSCRHGRHSLDHTRGRGAGHPPGHCQDCGARVVQLPEPGEVMPLEEDDYGLFAKLPKELIRAHYWKVPIDLKAYNQALRMGRRKLHERARDMILTALLADDAFSGRRAPYNGKIVAYAQHATATCCRRCASYWHGLPSDPSVMPTQQQLDYVVSVAHAYLDVRFPNLPEEPSRVPGVRSDAGPSAEEFVALEDNLVDAFVRHDDPAGLVIPAASAIQIRSGRERSGGYIEPSQISLPHPGAA